MEESFTQGTLVVTRCYKFITYVTRPLAVVVWRDQAEHAAESLSKGSRVVLVGRLAQRSWQPDDGTTRSVVEVVVDELGPSLRWATATTTRATRSRLVSFQPRGAPPSGERVDRSHIA